jgi:hypothetical protein
MLNRFRCSFASSFVAVEAQGHALETKARQTLEERWACACAA